MKVVLLGYMASGKSAVGKVLAEKLYLPFVDLDDYIAKKEAKSIPQIFKEKGEIYFRRIEHQYLKEILNSDDKFVLSLGGGTPCYAGNMKVILQQKETTSFYLQTSITTIVTRLQNGKSERPLVASLSDEKLTEFVAKHIFERRNYYELANNTIKTDQKSISEIASEIRIILH